MADFSLAPDFVFTKKGTYDTIISQFENGVEQRRPRRTNTIREWTLQYRNRPASEVATIQTMFDSVKGAYNSFTWTNPLDSVDYNVRFKEDTLDVSAKAYNVYDVEFSLVEVL